MTDHRKPQAFVIEDGKPVTRSTARAPKITFDEEVFQPPALPPITHDNPAPNRLRWLPLLLASLTSLLFMWISLQTWLMIKAFFDQSPWLGWLATSIGAVAAISLVAIIIREIAGFMRLRALENLQRNAARAINLDDQQAAKATVGEVLRLYGNRPEIGAAVQQFQKELSGIMDPSDRIRLLDRNILQPLDAVSRAIVAKRTKRVALLTAVIPTPVLDVLLVAAQNFAMLREVAQVYGGRPSTFSTLRLARMVMTHLAVAGGLALSDSLIQNLIGKGLLGRVSARFGEGALNGVLTARIGIAAIEVCRPVAKDSTSRAELVSLVKETLSFGTTDAPDGQHQR
jgi:putative membrane protein